MSVRRFFDWSTPFIPTAARYIVESSTRRATDGDDARADLDLGKYVFALSGERAKRSLETYVQLEAHRAITEGRIAPDWTPPEYETIGTLLDNLYDSKRPIADDVSKLFCEFRALKKFIAESPAAKTLLPTSFESQNNSATLQLARSFLTLDQTLANERKTYRQVAGACERLGEPEEVARWRALDELATLYHRELDAVGLVDKNRARERALRDGAIGKSHRYGEDRLYRVLGAVDLAQQQIDIFAAIDERVEYWIFAPESEAELFDEYGRVVPDRWQNFELPVPVESFYQVDSPAEQGETVAALIRELSKVRDGDDWRYEPIHPEQLTIGLPDDEVAPFVEEQVEALGYGTIRGEGTPFVQNRVYKFLANVVDYLETRSFASLSELLACPDVDDFLMRKWNFAALKIDEPRERVETETPLEAVAREEREQEEAELEALESQDRELHGEDVESRRRRGEAALKECDDYRARFLQQRVSDRWFYHVDEENGKRTNLYVNLRKAVYLLDSALRKFRDDSQGRLSRTPIKRRSANDEPSKFTLEDFNDALDVARRRDPSEDDAFADKFEWRTNQRTATPREWAPIVAQFVGEIYGVDDDSVVRTRAAQEQINAFLLAFYKKLDSFSTLASDDLIDGSTAVRTLLSQLSSGRTPPLPGSDRIELQGWLDLIFDDAPYVIVTGFNESVIPSTRRSDVFLPNETRRALGMSDSKRAFARDAYVAATLAHSRNAAFFVFERRSLQNDPKIPSRFVFAAAPENVPQRIVKFFGKPDKDALELLRERQLGRPFPSPRKSSAKDDEAPRETPVAALSANSARATRERGVVAPRVELRGRNAPSIMNVTDFEAFLSSPYRYFLKRVNKLRVVRSPEIGELDAAEFGTTVHNLLKAFVDSKVRDSKNEMEIYQWLSARLDEHAKNTYNESTSPFVFVQMEEIRARLREFASWQARWRESGRIIKYAEVAPNLGGIEFDVGEDEPARIIGRIDRVDYSPEENRWYVFDYKTYDASATGKSGKEKDGAGALVKSRDDQRLFSAALGNTPDIKHRALFKKTTPPSREFARKYGLDVDNPGIVEAMKYQWFNLQLPLYRRLIAKILEERGERFDLSEIRLGYVTITSGSGVEAFGAPWGSADLECAEAVTRWVVRTIRRIWRDGVVDPSRLVDPEWPEFGTILTPYRETYADEYGAITLSGVD